MVERLMALLAGVPNPFAQVRVGSAWEPSPDIEAINAGPFQRCQELAEQVLRGGTSHGLLISGVAGTGKTHLLARVRRWLIEHERGWFVYLPPVTAPDRFFRHLLQYLAEDVLRTARQGVAATQLETAVARHLMANSQATLAETAEWWRCVRAEHPPGSRLHGFLRSALDPVTEALSLDGSVMRVLACYLSGIHRIEARDWLLGMAMPEDDLRALGVAVNLDDEGRARSAVFTLLRLAAPQMMVLLAFDQIEGLQRSPEHVEPLVAFGHGVRALLDGASNVLAVTATQVSFVPRLQEALGQALFEGGVAEARDSLQPLTSAQVHLLAIDRLRRAEDLQTVRMALRAHGDASARLDVWPLSPDKLSVWLGRDRPARDALLFCRTQFDESKALTVAGHPAAPTTVAPEPNLDDALATAVAAQLAMPEGIDDGVYEDGLARALSLLAPDEQRAPAPHALRSEVDLVLTQSNRRTAVSVCNARHMTSLAARLNRLLSIREQFDRLVVVRDARLPISPKAAATNARLKDLHERGAALIRPTAEAYAALAAVRKLLADAAAGDLTLGARSVPVEELAAWLARNMPQPVRELCADVSGGVAEAEAPALAALQALLQSRGLIELAFAAEQAQVRVEAAREAARAHPDLVGHLEGPPEVLYLRSAGLRRD